jgi:hypothetical protein
MSVETTRATIDDWLGPHETRYLGHGFQRVRHRITDVVVDPVSTGGAVSAVAAVDYPVDWSTRSTDYVARPHLSTVDTLVISAQLADAYLTHVHSLDQAARARMWLRAFDMRAGAVAQQRLTGIDVQGRRRGVRPRSVGPLRVVSLFDFRVGTIRLSCEVEHDVGTPNPGPANWLDIECLLGRAERRQFGRGFANRRHEITGVTINPVDGTASASLQVEQSAEHAEQRWEGISAAYEPTMSMLDATICGAQLAQVLAYRLEDTDRATTGNFWMRRFGMRSSTPSLPIADPITMSGQVVGRKRIDRMGLSWRIYDLAGTVHGITTTASVAFNMPGNVTA